MARCTTTPRNHSPTHAERFAITRPQHAERSNQALQPTAPLRHAFDADLSWCTEVRCQLRPPKPWLSLISLGRKCSSRLSYRYLHCFGSCTSGRVRASGVYRYISRTKITGAAQRSATSAQTHEHQPFFPPRSSEGSVEDRAGRSGSGRFDRKTRTLYRERFSPVETAQLLLCGSPPVNRHSGFRCES
jgi:hypothetical protein